MGPPLLTGRSAFHRARCRWRGHRPVRAYVTVEYVTTDRGETRTLTAPCDICSRCNVYTEEPDIQVNPRWVLTVDLLFAAPEGVLFHPGPYPR